MRSISGGPVTCKTRKEEKIKFFLKKRSGCLDHNKMIMKFFQQSYHLQNEKVKKKKRNNCDLDQRKKILTAEIIFI